MLLITRPLAQSKNLEMLLKEAGLDYALFPSFEVKKTNTKVSNKNYDVIIFISVNSVDYAKDYFNKIFIEPFKVFAVGPITAQRLVDNEIKVDCFPEKNASSKELLLMKECSELHNKKILIVRGKGGSETLQAYLSELNEVDYLEVYDRVPCEYTKLHSESVGLFLSSPKGVLMASSNENLSNTVRLLTSNNSNNLDEIKSRKLIVFSQKIQDYAQKLGFINIKVTLNPSDQDLLNEFML
ncbi:MAG: uroporphyrinogen-III synthase [Rhodobacteraceae bacterium]|nr:uroporphyrinogen-III synthase [Paracoccaceae bacterium]